MDPAFEIRHHVHERRDIFQDWPDGLADVRARIAILRRLDHVTAGNFGDCKFCGEGIWEMRVDVGPGYRIYYCVHERAVIVLLCAGVKNDQHSDIKRAIRYRRDISGA